jgi:WD40 repeat protein
MKYPDVRLWRDVSSAKAHETLKGDRGQIKALAFSPDSKTLAGAKTDGTIRLWDVARAEQRDSFKEHSEAVLGLAYSPSGALLASAGANKRVTVWNTLTGNPEHKLEGHKTSVQCVGFASDQMLISVAEYKVTLWWLPGMKERWWLPETKEWFSFDYLQRPPPGRFTVRVTRSHVEEPEPLLASLVALSPDGKALAVTTGEDVVLWHLPVPEQQAK